MYLPRIGLAALLLASIYSPTVTAQPADSVALPEMAAPAETTISAGTEQVQDTAVVEEEQEAADAPVFPRDEQFPQPLCWALFVAALCGLFGSLAADLAADGGILEWISTTEKQVDLGFFANIFVGPVAAVAVLTLNPPGGWAALIGTALVSGMGGEAVIMSIVNARKALTAQAQKTAVEDAGKANVDGMTMSVKAFVAGAGASPGSGAVSTVIDKAGTIDTTSPLIALLEEQAEIAKAELTRIARAKPES